MRRGPIQIFFGPYCVYLVYFILKSTGYHVMQTGCQRILFHFLLIIPHNSSSITKCFPISYSLQIFAPPSLFLLILSWYTVIGGNNLHKEKRDDIMMLVVHTEERGGMMSGDRGDMTMIVVLPTQLLTSRNE